MMRLDLPVRETLAFLDRFLPPPPARLLEVGCSDGRVALALAARGYRVTGLDEALDAPEDGPPDTRFIAADFLFYEEDDPYDVVLFTRTLHHMAPVGKALDRARELLRPGGVLLAEEFAYERVNVHTARWLYDLEAVLVAAEILTPPDSSEAAEIRPLARWKKEHEAEPPLVTGHDLLAAARERFELTAVEEAPYFYRYIGERMKPIARSARVLATVFELESRLLRERDIAGAGLRLVAHRTT